MTIEECRVGDLVIGNERANGYGITIEGFVGEIIAKGTSTIAIKPVWTKEDLIDFIKARKPNFCRERLEDNHDWYERSKTNGWVVCITCFDPYEPKVEGINLSDYLM